MSKPKKKKKDPRVHGGPMFLRPESYKKVERIAAAKKWSNAQVLDEAIGGLRE